MLTTGEMLWALETALWTLYGLPDAERLRYQYRTGVSVDASRENLEALWNLIRGAPEALTTFALRTTHSREDPERFEDRRAVLATGGQPNNQPNRDPG